MKEYFYHGIDAYPGCGGRATEIVLKILNEGLIVRNVIRNCNNQNLNHVCLFKKNPDVDYEDQMIMLHSARSSWIDYGFVFILRGDLDAKKAIVGQETDLVDEWRYYGNISPDNIIGIGLPYDFIESSLNEKIPEDNIEEIEDQQLLKTNIGKIIEICNNLNIPIFNSDQRHFTDEIDKMNLDCRVK